MKTQKGNGRVNNMYKGRFLIALYEGGPQNDEWLAGVYNGVKDMHKQTKIPEMTILKALWRIEHQPSTIGANSIHLNGKMCTIHKIELTDQEIESGEFDNVVL